MRYSITNATVEQIKAVGGQNIKQLRHVPMIYADLTDTHVAQLRAKGCTISNIGKVRADISPPVAPPTPRPGEELYTPQELSSFAGWEKIRAITDPPLYGLGFNLALLDTGIRETHELINGRVAYSKNFTSGIMRDGFNHGTGVCSIAVAIAPLCNILNMKVLGDDGGGTDEEVSLAIDECIGLYETDPAIAPTVINLSLGCADTGNPDEPMRVACRAAIEAGIIVIAAVGSGGPNPNSITSPACERYVGGAGSVKLSPFTVSEFSSRGPTKEGIIKPDAVAFGENVIMASSESDTATVAKSGTSFSTPMISGTTLLFQEGATRRTEFAMLGTPRYVPGPLFTAEQMIDFWVPQLCLKPVGSPAEKDNDVGHGMPFGDLIIQAFVPSVGPAILSQMIPAMIMIGMMGMIAGIMKK